MLASSTRNLLRLIPPVGGMLEDPSFAPLIAKYPRQQVIELLRAIMTELRQRILVGQTVDSSVAFIKAELAERLAAFTTPQLRSVVNATGVVLNTNLGRAPLPAAALERARTVGGGYSNLEYDLVTGRRGERHGHLERLLVKLTGAEAALAVNNNAAAVLLVVDTLARGREVIVSRGELVEIGGSFRIPEVITASGAKLREVGTTNKTRLADYQLAIGPATGLLLKCHTSNFRIVGFTESVAGSQLAQIGQAHGIPTVEDLGSGTLVDLTKWGLPYEPTVPDTVANGLDLVTFSGDKLLGGPQAGIIIGRRALLDRLKQNPLLRALRLDKMTIMLLEATLLLYLDCAKAQQEVPVLRMLASSLAELQAQAARLAARLGSLGLAAEPLLATSQPGGGSLPGIEIPTWVVRITDCAGRFSLQTLANKLRLCSTPVIGRMADNALWLDMRTLLPGDDERIMIAFQHVL